MLCEQQLHYTNGAFAVSSRMDRTNGRDGMPKDATKNVDRYKVRGGTLNEFDYHKNQEAFTENEQPQKGTKGTKKRAGKPGKSVSMKKSARK